ncbi:hypothetical protein VN47_003081 [Escherichia coli]|uniref:hypothetical protein n=1 Tax=Escherichia coli TaxID=562 RepID=UPI00044EC4FC|nr:hypothetical protein [Escherichia coli]EEY9235584.1 hypothetical protein [Escherichia coli]EFM8843124.1 hypothetical protein [Escherichia coli]EGZ7593665.1 hypothetical protein [Escherichia coli]EGZ7629538.1 hypothetical protein [Escherichia coli]EGZ9130378.1 hypothetical protein [Escherichia coli]
MKIKQHKEKLEIIRDIIRETLLGNAALIVLAAMVPVVLVKPWVDSMTFIFMGAVCVSFAVILFWLVYIVCLYIGTLVKNIFIRIFSFSIWALSAEGAIIYNMIKILS